MKNHDFSKDFDTNGWGPFGTLERGPAAEAEPVNPPRQPCRPPACQTVASLPFSGGVPLENLHQNPLLTGPQKSCQAEVAHVPYENLVFKAKTSYYQPPTDQTPLPPTLLLGGLFGSSCPSISRRVFRMVPDRFLEGFGRNVGTLLASIFHTFAL